MANSIKFMDALKGSWKAILWGLIPVVIVVIIFALPLKTVPVEETEKYWATEMKQEPYTAQETYTDVETYMTTETRTETVYDSWVSTNNWNYSFPVNKPGATVTVTTYGTPAYYYPRTFEIYTTNGTYSPYYSNWWPFNDYYYNYGSSTRVMIKISYPEDVAKQRAVTKTRDVTKYREVPTQVQKERKVIKYINVSIWSYLFMDQKK